MVKVAKHGANVLQTIARQIRGREMQIFSFVDSMERMGAHTRCLEKAKYKAVCDPKG